MTTLTITETPTILSAECTADDLTVTLSDGRRVTAPVAWYPRLSHAKAEHREHCVLMGGGRGIHWPEVDEDISAENILFGQPSGESDDSFRQWEQWYHETYPASGEHDEQ